MSERAAGMISYPEYLQTRHWKALRWCMLWIVGGRCQACKSSQDLEVHHASGYSCLYEERPEDLIVLCARCHQALEDSLLAGAPPPEVEARP